MRRVITSIYAAHCNNTSVIIAISAEMFVTNELNCNLGPNLDDLNGAGGGK